MVATWTGGGLHWYPGRDGYQEWPSPDGFIEAQTSQRPDWSIDGKFGDPRPWKYAPVPSRLGKYYGLYQHGYQVVFSYRIGQTGILDSPGFADVDGSPIFTRTLNLGRTEETLSLQVLSSPDGADTELELTDPACRNPQPTRRKRWNIFPY